MTVHALAALYNSVVVAATVTLVLGLMAATGSWHSLWGLLMLLAASSSKSK